MNDLYPILEAKTRQLEYSVKQLRGNGAALARAERDYKVLLRKKCLEMRAEGMPIGLIEKTCYGVPEVAEARFLRDSAEAVYKANLEAINSLKLQMRLLESQIGREWSNG